MAAGLLASGALAPVTGANQEPPAAAAKKKCKKKSGKKRKCKKAVQAPVPTPAALSVTPTAVDFDVHPTIQVVARLVTVTNAGGSASGVPNAIVSGTNASEFTVADSSCTAPIPAGHSCAMALTHKAASNGNKSATLSVVATPGGAVNVPLTAIVCNTC
jgi:hypothetical protein